MRIVIDVERCSGHGRCYDLAPTLFEPDDDGYSVVIAGDDDDHEAAARAVSNCPEDAISIEP